MKSNTNGQGTLDRLERKCKKWFHVIAIAATSGARAVIPTLSLDLETGGQGVDRANRAASCARKLQVCRAHPGARR